MKLLASTIIKHTGGSVVVMKADERLVSDLSAEQWNCPEEKSTVSIHASVVW